MEFKHFTLNRWVFRNDTLRALHKSMTEIDRKTFDFDIWDVSIELLPQYISESLMLIYLFLHSLIGQDT